MCVGVCVCVWLKLTHNWLYVTTQLQLLQKVQEAEGVISIAMDFVGDQNELEATLADIQVGYMLHVQTSLSSHTSQNSLLAMERVGPRKTRLVTRHIS